MKYKLNTLLFVNIVFVATGCSAHTDSRNKQEQPVTPAVKPADQQQVQPPAQPASAPIVTDQPDKPAAPPVTVNESTPGTPTEPANPPTKSPVVGSETDNNPGPAKPPVQPPVKPVLKEKPPEKTKPAKTDEKPKPTVESTKDGEQKKAKLRSEFLTCLADSYGSKLQIGDDNNSVVFRDGTVMPFDSDSTKGKDFDAILNDTTDLSQMFLIPYKPFEYHAPAKNEDPGRIRLTPFFEKLYGNETDINTRVVKTTFMDQELTINEAIQFPLTRVLQDLVELAAKKPELAKYFSKSELGGSFKWRNIKGTERRSLHSYGVAVDLVVKYTRYWMWDRPPVVAKLQPLDRRTPNYPKEIVDIFEKHGFIWGGKWDHYDLMHFEYRPDLILCAGKRYVP